MSRTRRSLLRSAARAVVTDPQVPAKLSLDFGFAFGDYWIIEAGAQYEYLVVGHPSRDCLWETSRERSVPRATLEAALERARDNGFPVAALHFTQQ